MAQITIVGLGPGAVGDLTREAWQVLSEAREVWLRTRHHPVVGGLPGGRVFHSFDAVYEHAESFDEVYREICERVLTLGGRPQGVVYAVPGHPLVGEATVTSILERARAAQVPVRIVHGLSFIEPTLCALGIDALDGLQVFDALVVASMHHPPFNPDVPALVAQVYSRAVSSELKLVLMNQYADDHRVALIDAAGTPRERVTWIPLYEIDRQEATPLTTLFVPAVAGVTSFEGFQETVATLRAPEGCPWDREQTHRSLRTNLLEETYEVLAAIDAQDPVALREELGDLLLQIVLHSQIAVEEGEFHMTEVIRHIDAKLKRRHPHVWGDTDVTGVAEVISNWEAIKRREREAAGQESRSLLDGIPPALPALSQAAAYAARAGRIGLERVEPQGPWVDLPPSLEKAVRALTAALEDLQAEERDPRGFEDAVGDLLFVLTDWGRRQGLDVESALREANRRFARRLRILERDAQKSGRSLGSFTEDEMRALWQASDLG